MNLHLKNDCYELTITLDDCCNGNTTVSTDMHPDNLRDLFPDNLDNQYEPIAKAHSDAILAAYAQEQPGDSEETILEYIDAFLHDKYPLPDVPSEWAKRFPGPGDDGTTIFYPPIPDELLDGEFGDLRNAAASFDPATDRYQDLHARVVDFETRFMKLRAGETLAAKVLITTAMIRQTVALWIGIGNTVDPGVIYALGDVAQADVDSISEMGDGWSVNRQARFMARASRRAARAAKRN